MDPDMRDTVDMLLDVQGTLAIVLLLEQNEERLRDLYRAFAKRFPPYADFWNRIGEDEHRHAMWVSELADAVRRNDLTFEKNRFNTASLRDFFSYIEALLKRVPDPAFTPLEAATISLEVEENLIERHFFKVFASDTEILQITLNKLESSTEEHYRRVKGFAAKLR